MIESNKTIIDQSIDSRPLRRGSQGGFHRNGNNIILFDGICNFCNSSVNFIIRHDYRNRFKFAALQSSAGKELLRRFNIESEILKTIILIEEGRFFTKTTAVLKIAKQLKGVWKLPYIFIVIPPFLRNVAYNIIAKYRYRWFGRRNECRMPAEEERNRFLQ